MAHHLPKIIYRGIAQQVEQRSPKPRVVSSILTAPAKIKIKLFVRLIRSFVTPNQIVPIYTNSLTNLYNPAIMNAEDYHH